MKSCTYNARGKNYNQVSGNKKKKTRNVGFQFFTNVGVDRCKMKDEDLRENEGKRSIFPQSGHLRSENLN